MCIRTKFTCIFVHIWVPMLEPGGVFIFSSRPYTEDLNNLINILTYSISVLYNYTWSMGQILIFLTSTYNVGLYTHKNITYYTNTNVKLEMKR